MKPDLAVSWPAIYITGTDTGVGKTRVSCALLRSARAAGIDACGFKPVASGSRRSTAGLRNADALALQRAAGPREPYDDINPYALAPAIAPHLAAAEAGVRIQRRVLDAAHARLLRRHAWVVTEGAGGWQVPLGPRWTLADWVAGHRWPVVLVVAMRLGCINHALLSAESILARGCTLLGWVANQIPPRQARLQDNLDCLQRRMPAPLLGRLGPDATRLDDGLRAIADQLRLIRRP